MRRSEHEAARTEKRTVAESESAERGSMFERVHGVHDH